MMLFLGSISLRYLGDVGVVGTESEADDEELVLRRWARRVGVTGLRSAEVVVVVVVGP